MNLFGEETRLLVVAPHADDETLGAGGAIAHTVAAGGTARVLVATASDMFYEHAGRMVTVEERRGELSDACAALAGAGEVRSEILFPGFEARLDRLERSALVTALDHALARWTPTAVLFPYPSHHQDHRTLYQACLAALRPRGTPGPAFVGMYEYPFVHSHGDFSAPGHGLAYLQLTEEDGERKLTALSRHESQMEGRSESSLISASSVLLWMEMRGREIGVQWAEVYRVWRMHG